MATFLTLCAYQCIQCQQRRATAQLQIRLLQRLQRQSVLHAPSAAPSRNPESVVVALQAVRGPRTAELPPARDSITRGPKAFRPAKVNSMHTFPLAACMATLFLHLCMYVCMYVFMDYVCVSLFLCMSPIPACLSGIPDTCVKCVRAGRAWQVGTCNPTRECTVADVGCYQTEELCLKWGEQQKAKETCKKQQRCSDCMRADNYCGWWRKPSELLAITRLCPGSPHSHS